MNSSEPRRGIPLWVFLCWGVVALAYLVLGFFEVAGDPGMSNVIRLAIVLVSVVATLVWFLLSRRFASTTKLAVAAGMAVLVGIVFGFFNVRMGGDLQPRFTPRFGGDDPLASVTGTRGSVQLDEVTANDYPGFLGYNRDNQARGTSLNPDLEAHPPELLWRQPLGAALAGFAVVGNGAATLEHRGEDELATLYDTRTGELLWATAIDSAAQFGGGIIGDGPRTTPLIAEGRVFAVSVHGKVLALDASNGAILWQRDLLEEAGLSREEAGALYPYGRSSSPVLASGKLLIAPGGPTANPVSVAALDPETGRTLWQSGSHQISAATPAVATLAGLEQVLVVNEDFVTGHTIDEGMQLWQLPLPGKTSSNANVSNAVGIPPNRVFVSKGYGIGSALYELGPRAGGGFDAKEIWSSGRTMRTKFTNVAIQGDFVYGLSEGVLECIELATGERAWKAGRYGHGQILLVGDVLVVSSEDGEIFYVRATPERHEVLAEFQAIEGQTWNPIALADDVLLVRNSQEAAAYRLATL